jgi:hypothetical protein
LLTNSCIHREAEKTEENKVLPEGADVLAAHRDDEKPRVDDDATVAPLKEGSYIPAMILD